MEKQQVYFEIFPVDYKPFLSCYESEAIPQFEQKILNMRQQGLLKIYFRVISLNPVKSRK